MDLAVSTTAHGYAATPTVEITRNPTICYLAF